MQLAKDKIITNDLIIGALFLASSGTYPANNYQICHSYVYKRITGRGGEDFSLFALVRRRKKMSWLFPAMIVAQHCCRWNDYSSHFRYFCQSKD